MAKTLTPAEQAAIDAFLAKRQPTAIPTGATSGMTEKDWQQAVRTPRRQMTDAEAYEQIERDSETEMQAARERNGYCGS